MSKSGNQGKITISITWRLLPSNISPLSLIYDVIVFIRFIGSRGFSRALSQQDDQALIWDLIRGSQHEKGALAANISEKASSRVPLLSVSPNSRKRAKTSAKVRQSASQHASFQPTDETSVQHQLPVRPPCAGTCLRRPQWDAVKHATQDRTSTLQPHGANTFA